MIEGVIKDPNGVAGVRPAKPLDGNKGGTTEYVIPQPSKTINVKKDSHVNY